MDKEVMELLEEKLFVFSKRDDVEKLRQESNANFRKLKEENKGLILGLIDGIKVDMEGLRREGMVDIDPIREDIKEEMKKLELKIQSALFQSIQSIESSLEKMKEETNSSIHQSRQEMASSLQLIREEGRTDFAQSREEMRVELNRLGEGVGNLNDQIRTAIQEIMALNEKIKEGFNEVREELGSMIKFSYADLEKRFGTLEARVKALEKLVLP